MGFAHWWERIFGAKRAHAATVSPADLRAAWLIVGLGNPGARYAATRHNAGYMAVDDLLAPGGDVLEPVEGISAQAALVDVAGTAAAVVRSGELMNLSGGPVGELAAALGIPAEHIVVLHDELDLPAGKVRVKRGGGDGGHNGLKSLTQAVGSRDYLRVRIGIGRPPRGQSVPDYVLGPVDAGAEFEAAIATAAEAARLLVTRGLAEAQNRIHGAGRVGRGRAHGLE